MMTRPAPRVAHRTSTPRERVNWEYVRLLMEVARAGSFRTASEATGVSSNTLRRRVESLEAALGHILLARLPNGVSLTKEGKEVVRIAERIREEAHGLERLAKPDAKGLSGIVKVAVTEGLGTFWIIPRLVDFQQRYSQVTVDLWCDMRIADVSAHQADISVQLEKPTDQSLVVTRLGYLHLVLFASDEYLRLHGAPTRVEDLSAYHFVEQIAPQIPDQMLNSVVPNKDNQHFVTFRANTSTAHAYAISRGAGIGLLPTYTRAITRRVRPINVEFRLRRDIWLTYHPKVKDVKRVRAVIKWLRESFDPNRYPWFKEEFIPPDKLETDFIKDNVIYLFEGFLERGL